MPLLAGQQVLGALVLASPSISAFRPQNLRLLELVADLGALALFQVRQREAVDQQKKQLARLLEVARCLGTALDTRAIVGLTTSALRQLIPCEEAVVYRYEAGTETLCGMAGWGTQSSKLADTRIRISDPQSVTAWVAQQRRPLLHAGGAHGFVGRATGVLLAQRELGLLAAPVVAREQLWGVITMARAVPFEPGDLRTLLTLCQLIAPALVQAGEAREGWRR
jgi:transcriptional regulator with GAF, ATPase, and Fis domain